MSRPLQFRKHAIGTKPKQRGDIPFAFYRDSIALVQSEPGGGRVEESWKSFLWHVRSRPSQTCATINFARLDCALCHHAWYEHLGALAIAEGKVAGRLLTVGAEEDRSEAVLDMIVVGAYSIFRSESCDSYARPGRRLRHGLRVTRRYSYSVQVFSSPPSVDDCCPPVRSAVDGSRLPRCSGRGCEAAGAAARR